jgi:hypothetical protein
LGLSWTPGLRVAQLWEPAESCQITNNTYVPAACSDGHRHYLLPEPEWGTAFDFKRLERRRVASIMACELATLIYLIKEFKKKKRKDSEYLKDQWFEGRRRETTLILGI